MSTVNDMGRSNRSRGRGLACLAVAGAGILGAMVLPMVVLGQAGAPEPEQVVLAYDDGIPNLALTFLENAGTVFAVRFTPPEGEVKLTEIRYFLPDTSKGASCLLTVRTESSGEPGITLLGPLRIAATKIGWNFVNLSHYGLSLRGDFFVVLEYDGVAKLTLGAENREPLSNRTYDTDC